MNHVFLFGRIGAEIRHEVTQKGTSTARFSLAVRRRKGKVISWIQCIAYGKLADILRNEYGKGDQLLVKDGEIEVTQYSEGKAFWIVRVRLIERLGPQYQTTPIGEPDE
jgi:single-stranded DNA-binding protein